jgi:hypothetical protein
MCYRILRADACGDWPDHYAIVDCCTLLQDLIQSCARGGRGIVEDMCYGIQRAETCVD